MINVEFAPTRVMLRVDERYDTAGGTIDANDPWRTLEVSTHSPGLVGALSPSPPALSHHGEREPVCASGQSTTPSSTTDYVYVYDAVGNLYVVLNDEGGEAYAFSQDAWGNELSIGSFTGTGWSSARTYGVTEHQTGKWIDPFTGLYFFHHRWYESGLGRWVSRADFGILIEEAYTFCDNSPVALVDVTGLEPNDGGGLLPIFKMMKCLSLYPDDWEKLQECLRKEGVQDFEGCCPKGKEAPPSPGGTGVRPIKCPPKSIWTKTGRFFKIGVVGWIASVCEPCNSGDTSCADCKRSYPLDSPWPPGSE